MDRKTSLPATNALTAASRRRLISRYPKEFAAAQIIPVTYCKLSEAISTRVLACIIRYHVTVTPPLRVNEQFAGTPTFRRSPRNAGNSDQTFPSPERLAPQDYPAVPIRDRLFCPICKGGQRASSCTHVVSAWVFRGLP